MLRQLRYRVQKSFRTVTTPFVGITTIGVLICQGCVNTRSGDKLVIVVHDDGRREMHHFDNDDPEDSISMVTLDDTEDRQVGGILGGMAYLPKALESVDIAFDDMVIEWYKVDPGSKSMKVINPGPDQVIKEGATLVVLGDRGQVKACKLLII